MQEISSDTFSHFARRVKMHGIMWAMEVTTRDHGRDTAVALLDMWKMETCERLLQNLRARRGA